MVFWHLSRRKSWAFIPFIFAVSLSFGQVMQEAGFENNVFTGFGTPLCGNSAYYGFVDTIQARLDVNQFTLEGMLNWGALAEWAPYKTHYIPYYNEFEYDTFCQCVFITGLSENNTEFIKQSEDYPSCCQHEECSMLMSFKPSILQYYQNKKKKYQVEITELTANLCFPLGIKLCFKSNEDYYPKPYESFLNIIRNEKGDIYYIVSMHYYRLISIEEFDKKYKLKTKYN